MTKYIDNIEPEDYVEVGGSNREVYLSGYENSARGSVTTIVLNLDDAEKLGREIVGLAQQQRIRAVPDHLVAAFQGGWHDADGAQKAGVLPTEEGNRTRAGLVAVLRELGIEAK